MGGNRRYSSSAGTWLSWWLHTASSLFILFKPTTQYTCSSYSSLHVLQASADEKMGASSGSTGMTKAVGSRPQQGLLPWHLRAALRPLFAPSARRGTCQTHPVRGGVEATLCGGPLALGLASPVACLHLAAFQGIIRAVQTLLCFQDLPGHGSTWIKQHHLASSWRITAERSCRESDCTALRRCTNGSVASRSCKAGNALAIRGSATAAAQSPHFHTPPAAGLYQPAKRR